MLSLAHVNYVSVQEHYQEFIEVEYDGEVFDVEMGDDRGVTI